MNPRATIAERDGQQVVLTICRECDKPLILPCRNEAGESLEVTESALKWADLLVCTACDELREERRVLRDAEATMAERVKASGIPGTFRNLKWSDMDCSGDRGPVVDAARAWSELGGGIMLYGPPGTGKTRLAATAVWARLQVRPVTWVSVAHLIAALQASFSDEDRRRAVRTLTGAGALALDDLDKVRPTETVLSQLFVAIDRRVSSGAPLFVTSNAAPQLLTERFGSAVTSRLLGYCGVFRFDGVDRRLRMSESREAA